MAASWILLTPNPLIFGNSVTQYLAVSGSSRNNGSEALLQAIARASYTLQNLMVVVTTNTSVNTSTVRTRKNGANGNLTVAIGPGVTGTIEDTVNSDTLVATDLFCYQFVTPVDGNLTTISCVSTVLSDPSGSSPPQLAFDPNVAARNSGLAFETPPEGCLVPAQLSSEIRVQDKFRTAATLSNMRLWVATNTLNVGTSTVFTRINNVNGTLTANIPFGVTGAFDDLTHSDQVNPGDTLNSQVTASGSSGTIKVSSFQLLSSSAGRRLYTQFDTSGGQTQAAGTTSYYWLQSALPAQATEALVQFKPRCAGFLKNLYFYANVNAHAGVTTITLRQNGADTALSVAIASGITGAVEDVVHTIPYVAADLLNWSIVTDGGAGAFTVKSMGVEQSQALSAGQLGLVGIGL